MDPAVPSPFLAHPEERWLCQNELCFAIYDSFPVSPGHVLVVTKRVVPTFFDCSPAEQVSLMALVAEVKRLLDERLAPRPDGYNVGFNAGAAAGQTVPHVHVHVIPRYSGDMADPRGGVRHVIPEKGNYLAVGGGSASPKVRDLQSPGDQQPAHLSLTTGPDRPLWPRLADRLLGASEVDLVASFVQPSGLDVIRKALFRAIGSGARIRLLVGDYLGISSPEALRRLLGWMMTVTEKDAALPANGSFEPALAVRLAEQQQLRGAPESFHPKAWRIADPSGGLVVVGSSNLSRPALMTGVEWNLLGEWGGGVSSSAGSRIDREVAAAFEDLWQQATPLSAEVVERYVARAAKAAELRGAWSGEGEAATLQQSGQGAGGFADSMDPEAADGLTVLAPRPWQVAALASLAAVRRAGYAKALVAVATGMGKTWLAAFDVVAVGRELGRLPRVLVIAHRAEILAQAEATLRQALHAAAAAHGWPAVAVTSWFAGAASDLTGMLVIASIQKLARPDGLAALAATTPFDYCVIDEVHHAEAPGYRRVMARLSELSLQTPCFTLGLTATPERTDGVDVAVLFDDILAAQATIGDGIAEGSLVPFRYRGLKDDVDYEQIPWRSNRFDIEALEVALENAPRMERLWVEWTGGTESRSKALRQQAARLGAARPRSLVFCCSRRHAIFVRDWLRKRGVAAAAVFAASGGAEGPVSDPRMASLAEFQAGRLEALCVVDIFNEGVDIPQVDRVVMLRPTESTIVFLQQLGRGLRAAEGKTRLEVIDFVGNHRVFARRIAHLLALSPIAANETEFALLRRFLAGERPDLPVDCVLDVEVEAKELLARFLPTGRAAVEEAYRGMRVELGRRPTPAELLHANYLPQTLRAKHNSWFAFCLAEGDLEAAEAEVAERFRAWLEMLETTALNKSYKMVVLRVLLDLEALWDGLEISRLAKACRTFLANHPALRADLAGAAYAREPGGHVGQGPEAVANTQDESVASDADFTQWWLKWPLSRWMDEQAGRRWFARRGEHFVADFDCPVALRPAFEKLTGELVDFRIAHYSRSRLKPPEVQAGGSKAVE